MSDSDNVRRVQELRRSNAARPIPARRARRQSTRANAKRAAIREHS